MGAGPLTVHGQAAAMPHPAIAADFHQPLDVHGDLFSQISFDAALLLDHPADLPHVVLGQILDAKVRADPGFGQDLVGSEASDAVDVGEPDLDALGPWK